MIGRYLRAAESVATAFWAGSSTGFAFLSPITFHATPDRQVFAGITERSLARLARVSYAAGAVAALAALVQRRPLRAGLTVAALTLVTYQERAIVPAMRDVDHGTPEYDTLHSRSTRVYGLALLLGYAQLALAAADDGGEQDGDDVDATIIAIDARTADDAETSAHPS